MGRKRGLPPVITMSSGHYNLKSGKFTKGGKVKDRETEVMKLLKFLRLDHKTDLMIILDPHIKHGEHSSTIAVNPNLPNTEFLVTFAHEILHYKGLPHNCDTVDMYFNSKSLKGDLLSKTLAAMLAVSTIENRKSKRT